MDAPTDQYAKGFEPGESVLDVGCGPGTATHIAAERTGARGPVVGFHDWCFTR